MLKTTFKCLFGALLIFSSCKKEEDPMDNTENYLVDLGSNNYAISTDNYYLEVNGDNAARISSFKWNGQEILAGSDINSSNWGSTFWASPQVLWNWPPPDAFDNDAYIIEASDNKIVATGTMDTSKTKLQFIKEFEFNADNNWIDITLHMVNHRTTNYSVAPWQITRVPATGLTFFPVDTSNVSSVPFAIKDTLNVLWFDYYGAAEPDGKLKADGQEGWLAYYSDNLVFVHKYDDVDPSNFASGEKDAELYVAPSKTYIEIEPQGALQMLLPGDTLTWKVSWLAADVPSTTDTTCGSTELVDLVRGLLL